MHFPKIDSPYLCLRAQSPAPIRVTFGVVLLFSLGLLPAAARHNHHSRANRHHQPIADSKPTSATKLHATSTSALPDTAEAAALSCSHTAAVQMAARINATRHQVSPEAMSRKEKRQLAHDIRLARSTGKSQIHDVRIAEQDQAIASGDVVRTAYSFRGTPYRMGGTSRSAFDCSGFVRYILSCADGVNLPRTAEQQYYSGIPVDRSELQAGDLVFFKNTYKHGISHVGIYVGNGKFVHAANPHKGVREDSLDTAYYVSHYAGARRVMPEQMRRFE